MKQSPARRYRRDILGVAALAIVIALGGVFIAKAFHLTLLTYVGIYAIAALGMFVLFGYAGQISLGQAAFFGVGAYVSALIVMRTGLPSVVALVASVAAAALFGWLVSRPLLRLTTNYLAMATLAFGVICYVVFVQAVPFTGGLDPGTFGVPSFGLFGFEVESSRARFLMVGLFLLLCMFIVVNLVHSRFGRALRALDSSEVAAAGLGIDVVRHKVAAFTLAAAMAGLAGALFAFVQGSFGAGTFTVGLSIELLIMVVVGSLTSPWGALFGSLFTTMVPALLEDFQIYKLFVFGLILTLVMVYMPNGFASAVIDYVRALMRKRWPS
jgi:branched-chain amino acid transport system permease protein